MKACLQSKKVISCLCHGQGYLLVALTCITYFHMSWLKVLEYEMFVWNGQTRFSADTVTDEMKRGKERMQSAKLFIFSIQHCFFRHLSKTAWLLLHSTTPLSAQYKTPHSESRANRDQVNTAMVMCSLKSHFPLSVKGIMLLNSKNLLGQ